MSIEDLMRLPAILGCRITDLLPESVVTDYDRQQAKDPLLDRIVTRWTRLPPEVQESLVFLVEGARLLEEKKR